MLLGVPEKKSDAQIVPAILHSIVVYCKISEIQRSGKLLPEHNRASTTDVTQRELSWGPDWYRPLLVTFGAEAEQLAALQNAKKLQDTRYSNVFVRKLQDTRYSNVFVRKLQDTRYSNVLARKLQDTRYSNVFVRKLQDTRYSNVFVRKLQDTRYSNVFVRKLQDTRYSNVFVRKCLRKNKKKLKTNFVKNFVRLTNIMFQLQTEKAYSKFLLDIFANGKAIGV